MKKYFPSLDKISQEAIAVAISTILVAWIIAKSPTLKRIVKNYEAD